MDGICEPGEPIFLSLVLTEKLSCVSLLIADRSRAAGGRYQVDWINLENENNEYLFSFNLRK